MSLFRLVGVSNFCSNSLSPFLSIVHILSSQAILFKFFFTHFSHDFLGWTFFLFLVISTSTTSHFWELMSPRMTWPYHGRQLWTIIPSIFTTTPTISRRALADTLSSSVTLHIHILITRRSTPRYLASFTTVSSHVSQQYNKSGLTQHW